MMINLAGSQLTPPQRNRIKRYCTVIVEEFPEPPTEYCVSDVGEIDQTTLPDRDHVISAHRKLLRANVVEVVDEVLISDNGSKRKIYQLDEDCYAVAKEAVDGRASMLPCGHGGIRNLGDGDYCCTYAGCSEVFDESDVDRDSTYV